MERAPFDITERYLLSRVPDRIMNCLRVDIWFKDFSLDDPLSFIVPGREINSVDELHSQRFIEFHDAIGGTQIFATDTIFRIAYHLAQQEEVQAYIDSIAGMDSEEGVATCP